MNALTLSLRRNWSLLSLKSHSVVVVLGGGGLFVYLLLFVVVCVVPPTVNIVPGDNILVTSNGSILELICSVTGIPPPVITWSRNGQTLVANGSRVVIMEGSLLVSEMQRSDSGTYHCSASSSAGLASTSLQVLVLDMSATSMTSGVIRDDVVLQCSNQELPPGTPVIWLFNQSRLGPVSTKHVVAEDGSLLLLMVWLEDMGDYICQVGGQVNLTHTLSLTGEYVHTYTEPHMWVCPYIHWASQVSMSIHTLSLTGGYVHTYTEPHRWVCPYIHWASQVSMSIHTLSLTGECVHTYTEPHRWACSYIHWAS